MKTDRAAFVGCWRIKSIPGWAKQDLDLVVPAYIEFDTRQGGSFQFCALSGDIDYRVSSEADGPVIEWSWAGDDDGTETSGRGWAHLERGKLVGRLCVHHGEEFTFSASPHEARRRSTVRSSSES